MFHLHLVPNQETGSSSGIDNKAGKKKNAHSSSGTNSKAGKKKEADSSDGTNNKADKDREGKAQHCQQQVSAAGTGMGLQVFPGSMPDVLVVSVVLCVVLPCAGHLHSRDAAVLLQQQTHLLEPLPCVCWLVCVVQAGVGKVVPWL